VGLDPEAARVIVEAEPLPDLLADLVVGVDIERKPLRPGLPRARCELREQRLHHPLPARLGAGAGDVDVRLPALREVAEDEAGDLAVLIGDEHELAFEDVRPDLGPGPWA